MKSRKMLVIHADLWASVMLALLNHLRSGLADCGCRRREDIVYFCAQAQVELKFRPSYSCSLCFIITDGSPPWAEDSRGPRGRREEDPAEDDDIESRFGPGRLVPQPWTLWLDPGTWEAA